MVDDLRPRRPYEAGDAPAVAALMNLVAEHAGGRPGFTAGELHGLVSALVRDPELDSGLLFDTGGELVAAGFTTTPPRGGYRVHVTGGVHPTWRGRGIGRELLRRHLDRAVDIHREHAPHAEWEAQVRVPVGDTDALRLYRRLGLVPARYWFEMAATTTDAVAVAPPDGVTLLRYAPEHRAGVHAAHMEAFVDNWGHQNRDVDGWAATTVGSPAFLPELSLVALDRDNDDGPAGFLLAYEHTEPGRVYVGQVGVLKPWRRRGLAGAMLSGVLAAAARDGRAVVGLSVDADSPTGAVGVYSRAGFAVEFGTVTHSMRIGGP
jgi:mycothiol synthase